MSAPVSLQIIVGFILFALVFVPLERKFACRQQQILRSGWKTDITYYLTGCFLGNFSNAVSVGAMMLIRHAVGLNIGRMAAGQPIWAQFLEILLLSDFLAYWFHRSIHRYEWLWRFHSVHHSSKQMDWLVNVRLHPVDKLAGDCFQFIPIFCLGFSDAAILAYTIFLGFQTFLNHSNIRLNFGPLRWIVAGPQFHHWHHNEDPETYNKNFGLHLVIFDLLFGSAYFPPQGAMPERYGTSELIPEGFLEQMIHPFQKWLPSSVGTGLPANDAGAEAQPAQSPSNQ